MQRKQQSTKQNAQNIRKNNARKTGINTGKRQPDVSQTTLVVPRSVGAYMPDRLRTTLRFWKSVAISLTSPTTNLIRFIPSSVYDPDPVGGVTKPAGFAELAAIYGSYRVKSSYARVELINEGDVTTRVCLLPTNLDPGASPSANYVISSNEQPYAVSKTLSAVGGPVGIIENSMTTEKIFGSPMVKYDDNFAALTNTFPVNNWFWAVSFYALSAATKAVVCNFYMEMDVDFYDRNFTLRA